MAEVNKGGAPLGNQNAVKAKRWQQAIDRALAKRGKGDMIAELDRLAEKYLDTIEDMTVGTEKRGPSIGGFSDFADRLDGKPSQAVSVDAEVRLGRASELTDDALAAVISQTSTQADDASRSDQT